MVQIKKIVNSLLGSNTFLLTSNMMSDIWLIDIGDVQPIFDYMASNDTKVLKGVLLTHTHFDHIYGLNDLLAKYPDLIVYTSCHGYESLFSDQFNLSRYYLKPFIFQYNNIEIVGNGTKIEIMDNLFIDIYETPGHDWSSLCYKIENAVFTGDSYLPQYRLITNLPKSNKEDAQKSLTKIINLSAGCCIYPGHGNIVHV